MGQRALLRESLAALLQNTPYKVIASAPRASELKDVRRPAERPILVIIGVEYANGDGMAESAESIRLLRSIFPESRIVIVAENCNRIDMQHVMAPADAYVVNVGSRDILLKLLDLALLDQHVTVLPRSMTMPASHVQTDQRLSAEASPTARNFDARGAGIVAAREDDPLLSPREQQILCSLAAGDSNKQIARTYNITESTVKVHLKAILRKIAAHNRTQAAIWAVAKGYCHTRRPSEATEPIQHPHTLPPPAQIVDCDGRNGALMRNGKSNGQMKKAQQS